MSPPGEQEREVLKLYFKIGEVASILGVDTSAIRHWESEFRMVRPQRTRSGQRMYNKADVRKLQEIKRLLYEEKFTIKGAIKHLKARGFEPPSEPAPVAPAPEPEPPPPIVVAAPLPVEDHGPKLALEELRNEIFEFLTWLDRKALAP